MGPRKPAAAPQGNVTRHPEVIDDFIRNFFVRHGLVKTGEMFETEWYELKSAGKLDGSLGAVPGSSAKFAQSSVRLLTKIFW